MDKKRLSTKQLSWAVAVLTGLGAGILPLIWVLTPLESSRIERSWAFADPVYAAVSCGVAVVLLIAAVRVLFLLWQRNGDGKGYRSFGFAVALNAVLVLRLFVVSLLGDSGDSLSLLLFPVVVAVYVQLIPSFFQAYRHANKAGRVLLIPIAALCSLSIFFSVVFIESGFYTYNPFPYYNLSFTACPYPYDYKFNSYEQVFSQISFFTVTLPYMLVFILRAVVPLLPAREPGKTKEGQLSEEGSARKEPGKDLQLLIIPGLIVLFVCALLTHNHIRRPQLDLSAARDIGITYHDFLEKHSDVDRNIYGEIIIRDKDDGFFTVAIDYPREGWTSSNNDFYFYDSSPNGDSGREDSVCARVVMHNARKLFLNPGRDYSGFSIMRDDLHEFAKRYGLTYVGITMADAYADHCPNIVFQDNDYQFYVSVFSASSWSFDEYVEYIRVVVVQKPEEDGLPVPEIKINYLPKSRNSEPFLFMAFNGLAETGFMSVEEFADMYDLTIVSEEHTNFGNTLVLEFKGRQYKIDLGKSEYINPFCRISLITAKG